MRDALAARDAVAFVHAGSDADAAVFGCDAVVVTADRAVGVVDDQDGTRECGPLAVRRADDPARTAAQITEAHTGTTGTVLAPLGVRHDAARFLERAGFTVDSTTALHDARATKTAAEADALRHVGTATTAGVDATTELLSAARVGADGRLRVGANDAADERLTPASLRRRLAVTLAGEDVDADDTRVFAPGTDLDDPLAAGRPVVVDCRPRGPAGVRLRAAWTLVVDGEGGWDRRAHVALRAAHRAGRNRLTAAVEGETTTAGSVAGEVRAELTAYGFENPTVAVHGVGLAARESPRDGDELAAGQAVVVAARVGRDGDGTASDEERADALVRAEPYLLTDGVERLVDLPTSLSLPGTPAE